MITKKEGSSIKREGLKIYLKTLIKSGTSLTSKMKMSERPSKGEAKNLEAENQCRLLKNR